MMFSIHSHDLGNASRADCEITIRDYKERFPLITTVWSPERYEFQWIEALKALVAGEVDKCILITDIQNLSESYGLSYWALFRVENLIYMQERFSRREVELLLGSPRAIAPHIPVRLQGTSQEQLLVSEWEVSVAEVVEFIEQQGA